MKSEEEQLRRRVEERQQALRAKVTTLKQRIERVKRMGDINSAVRERPAVVFAGSVLTGFLLRKMAGRKTWNWVSNGAYRTDYGQPPSQTVATAGGRLWDPVIAIFTGVATRAAVDLVAEVAKRVIPRRPKTDQLSQNSRNNP
jgi:hypothetical protein